MMKYDRMFIVLKLINILLSSRTISLNKWLFLHTHQNTTMIIKNTKTLKNKKNMLYKIYRIKL